MRLTVLNQFSKGLEKSDPESGKEVSKKLTRAKWFFWHGNIKNGIECIEDINWIIDSEEIKYKKRKKFIKLLEEMNTYVENNRQIMPNYGERWRYAESISSSFVESTVNEVVTSGW